MIVINSNGKKISNAIAKFWQLFTEKFHNMKCYSTACVHKTSLYYYKLDLS